MKGRRFFFYGLLILGLVLLMFLMQGSAQTSSYTEIAFNWSYTPNLPVCGSVNVACFAGFRMSDLLSGHVVSPLLAPSARSWIFVPAKGVQYGKHTFELVAVGYDANGVLDKSTPASVVLDVVPPPIAPFTLRAMLQ